MDDQRAGRVRDRLAHHQPGTLTPRAALAPRQRGVPPRLQVRDVARPMPCGSVGLPHGCALLFVPRGEKAGAMGPVEVRRVLERHLRHLLEELTYESSVGPVVPHIGTNVTGLHTFGSMHGADHHGKENELTRRTTCRAITSGTPVSRRSTCEGGLLSGPTAAGSGRGSKTMTTTSWSVVDVPAGCRLFATDCCRASAPGQPRLWTPSPVPRCDT
jgi:hypothetical protein